MMRVLALDFDGVLFDSAAEAFVVALRAYRREFEGCRFGADAERDAKLYAGFLELMALGNRAEDYGAALYALEHGIEVEDQAAYDAVYQGLPRARLRAFHKRFYRVRQAFASQDPEAWFAATRPYPGILPLLRKYEKEVRLALATAKDRRSVRYLLQRAGASDLFPEAFVHDKETGVSKCAHIEALAADVGCGADQITFIDDKVRHLLDVSTTGARCMLAGWGYNGPREQRQARAAGFLVVDEALALEPLLFAPGPARR